MTFDYIITNCHQVKSPKIFQFNMVTFGDMSWHSMQKGGFGLNGAHFPNFAFREPMGQNFAAEMAKFWEMGPV